MSILLKEHTFQKARAKSPIAVVSLAVGDVYRESVAPLIISNNQYFLDNQIDYIIGTEEWLRQQKFYDPNRPTSWFKLPLLCEILPFYQTVVWMDADCLVMRQDLQPSDLLPVCTNQTIQVGPDLTHTKLPANLGLIVIQPENEREQFAISVELQTLFLDPLWKSRKFWEQSAYPDYLDTYQIDWTIDPRNPCPWNHLLDWGPATPPESPEELGEQAISRYTHAHILHLCGLHQVYGPERLRKYVDFFVERVTRKDGAK